MNLNKIHFINTFSNNDQTVRRLPEHEVQSVAKKFMMKSIAFLSLTIFLQFKSVFGNIPAEFKRGQTVQWLIDLSPKNAGGILCPHLEARLLPGKYDEELQSDIYDTNYLNLPLVGETPRNGDGTIESETGSRYKMRWTVTDMDIDSGLYSLLLFCGGASKENMLATSEPFIISDELSSAGSDVSTWQGIRDISPREYFDDSNFECPIYQCRMQKPVTDGYHTMEASALLESLKHSSELVDPDSLLLLSPFRYGIREIRIDTQMIAKMEKYSEQMLQQISTSDEWAFVDYESQRFSLGTRQVFKCRFNDAEIVDYLKASKHELKSCRFKSKHEVRLNNAHQRALRRNIKFFLHEIGVIGVASILFIGSLVRVSYAAHSKYLEHTQIAKARSIVSEVFHFDMEWNPPSFNIVDHFLINFPWMAGMCASFTLLKVIYELFACVQIFLMERRRIHREYHMLLRLNWDFPRHVRSILDKLSLVVSKSLPESRGFE